jgi:superfamily II RNA helicase
VKLESKLLVSLGKRAGNVVLRRDFSGLAGPTQLSEGISRLVGSGRLVRLGAGLYAKAQPDATGRARLLAEPVELVREVFEKLGISIRSVELGADSGQPIVIVDAGDQRVARKLHVAGMPVRYVKQSVQARGFETLPLDLDAMPTKGVSRFIERFARANGVCYVRTGLDDYAEAVTRTAGDDVVLDGTGKLLATLKKKNLINGRQLARLMTNHTREMKRVRSIRRLRKRGIPA